MRPDVVPEPGVVLHHARVDHEADPLLVVRPAVVVGRDADAGERAEDRHAGGAQPGVVAAPERRVRAQGEQDRHMHAHPVGHVDRLVGVVEADVHVQPEDQLLPGHPAQLFHEVAVALGGRDALVLPARERVRAGRADAQPVSGRGVGDLTPQAAQLGARLGQVGAGLGRHLEHRLHELRLDLAVRRVLLQALDRVHELERLGVEDHQLLFDADRVRGAGELRLHVAAYSTRLLIDERRGAVRALGYDGKLYILAFDHRGSFQKKMFGIEGEPTAEQTETISDAKRLIFEGMLVAVERGVDAAATGVLVDEQFGSDIPERAKQGGLVLSMPVEKSGQDEFDFQYDAQFGDHIERFDPDFAKVLVRLNPDGDPEMNERQLGRLKELADWLHEHDRKFLFELLVPAEDSQLESVGGDTDRYDAELRPELMRRAIEDIQNRGIEVDIWKIEGVDEQSEAETLAQQTRKGEGRENVKTVLLGRGASDDKVDLWLRQAAPVEGFIGFAIGRSIWWDALKSFLDGGDRRASAEQIADNYQRFIKVYDEAEHGAAV